MYLPALNRPSQPGPFRVARVLQFLKLEGGTCSADGIVMADDAELKHGLYTVTMKGPVILTGRYQLYSFALLALLAFIALFA